MLSLKRSPVRLTGLVPEFEPMQDQVASDVLLIKRGSLGEGFSETNRAILTIMYPGHLPATTPLDKV